MKKIAGSEETRKRKIQKISKTNEVTISGGTLVTGNADVEGNRIRSETNDVSTEKGTG